MPIRISALAGGLLASLPFLLCAAPAPAQEQLPWARGDQRYQQQPADEAYRPDPRYSAPRTEDVYRPNDVQRPSEPYAGNRSGGEAYAPRYGSSDPTSGQGYRPPRGNDAYTPAPPPRGGDYAAQGPNGYGQPYSPPQGYSQPNSGYGQPYGPPQASNDRYERDYGPPGPDGRRYDRYDDARQDSYSSREIIDAGHGFFGSISKGMASVVEYAFQKQGRPNGYILGQDAGGAFVAGLRYGEGTLYTRDAGTHRVYWQGPSIGWDAGGDGSKVMVLVYNLRDPADIYRRFGGVDGSAYIVGGVGLTFQKNGDLVTAPIRTGLGLRLGANVGYLKYTRAPTWNPF